MVAFDNFMVFSFESINNSKLILFQSKKKSKINMLCSKVFKKVYIDRKFYYYYIFIL
jgi:hypothetical protein